MFCGKCGAQLPDRAVFCSKCGARLDSTVITPPAAPAVSNIPRTSGSGNKNKIIGIAVVAVAVILVVILCVSLFGGRSYESVVKTYVTAAFKGDAKSVIGLFPDKFLDILLEEEDITEKELISEANDALAFSLDMLDVQFDDWTYSYEITDVDDLSTKEIKSMNESLEDFTDFTIKEAKSVTVEITITGDDDEYTTSAEIIVTKVGRSWYLLTADGLF